jgi:hypothetical protein
MLNLKALPVNKRVKLKSKTLDFDDISPPPPPDISLTPPSSPAVEDIKSKRKYRSLKKKEVV